MRETTRALTVTVTDCSPESLTNLGVLLSTLSEQRVGVEMVLVERGGPSGIAAIDGGTLHTLRAPKSISLSRARNLALSFIDQRGLLNSCDLVAFPDDDASYPTGTLQGAAASMAAHQVDLLCGVFLPADGVLDTRRFPPGGRPLTPKMVPGIGSSNNLFLSAKAVQEVGRFDERFGLGAHFGSSEDVDYAFRALFAGYQGWYDPQVAVYHPYKDHRPAEYFKGGLAVVGKHILQHPRLLAKLLYHSLRWGGHLMRQGDLSPMGYIQALGAMLSALR
jgi:hypothetical protein